MMIIIYRPDRSSDARIEAVRSAYKMRFGQKSVLHVESAVCASF